MADQAASTASLKHLLARLALVESRVRRAVALRRTGDPDPDDAFRGLYLSEAAVDRLLAPVSSTLVPDQTEICGCGACSAASVWNRSTSRCF